MGEILDARTVRGRFRDYGLAVQTQIVSLLYSGFFALAAVVLLDILRTPDHRLLRLSQWIIGMSAETMILVLQVQRPVLMARAGMLDLPVLIVRGVLALAVFALIAPQYGGADGWRYVYFGLVPLVVCSWILGRHFITIAASQRYSDGMRPLVDRIVLLYREQTEGAKAGVVLVCAVGLLTTTAPHDWSFVEPVAFGYNVLGAGYAISRLLLHQQVWRELERDVGEAARVEDTEGGTPP